MSEGLPLHWRLIPQRYNLEGTRCESCNKNFFPPRDVCPYCRRRGKVEKINFSGNGKVYTYTTVHAPPEGFEFQKPYVLAIVKLEEGPLITSQIVDCKPEEVEIGKEVKTVFRKVMEDEEEGIIRYSYKFRLKERQNQKE